jgi:hypothetical protein
MKELGNYYSETSNIQEFEIAEIDANGFPSLVYVALEFPMLLTDRDSVSRITIKKIDDKTLLF